MATVGLEGLIRPTYPDYNSEPYRLLWQKMNGVTRDEPVSNMVAINLSGRFKGPEVKDLGQAFLHHVVAAKHVGLVLGQQVGNYYLFIYLFIY